MAGTSGKRTDPLIAELLARPGAFDFFQAVRLYERHAACGDVPRGVGEDNAPDTECVRLRTRPSLVHAHAELLGARRREEDSPAAELDVAFLGFVGPVGVLPQHYTAAAIERLQLRDPTLRDWLDLFQHRVLSLFYRAWTKYRFPFGAERERREHGRDDVATRALRSLVGLGSAGLAGRLPVSDDSLLYEGGHLGRRVRTAEGLARAVSDLFGVPARAEEFVGRWLTIPADERCRLPHAREAPGLPVQLGRGATLGARTWDVQSKVRLHLGPLSLADHERLRPGGDEHAALVSFTQFHLGTEFDFDLRIELAASQSPGTRLMRPGGGGGSRLGRNTWLENDPARAGRRVAVVTIDKGGHGQRGPSDADVGQGGARAG